VVDISSDEEDLIPNTSQDEKFTKRFFGDLKHELLTPPGDSKVIILSNSDEEEDEVHEEDAAPSFAVKSPAPTASAADTDDAPEGVQDDSNSGCTPDQAQGRSSSGRDEAGLP
jgi:hypothetical protein